MWPFWSDTRRAAVADVREIVREEIQKVMK